MKIQGQRTDVLRPATPAASIPAIDAPKAQPTGGQPSGGASGARRSDSVQISDAGRAMSTGEASGSLTPERVAELRRRVLEGAYNANHVVNQVAQRILERGDV
jgi:negative regulator of flagellin synthesis FlgM